MSRLQSTHVFTSESVSEGHPDKIADQISDAILDASLKQDPNAHVACETAVGPNLVVNLGEITCEGWEKVSPEAIARDVVRDIGYNRPEEAFSFDTFKYINALHGQSPDIKQGVDRGSIEDQGAGDQGIMFGYATNETPEMMPSTLVYAHRLVRRCAELRKSGAIPFLRPDAKAQVSIQYEGGRPAALTAVVLSHQTEDIDIEIVQKTLKEIAMDVLGGTGLIKANTQFHLNPTGKFVTGGPNGDAGVTGRKIIVDTYGGAASHGGGAFSGKDPSKVDRSAAYYARYAAKNIVAAGLADKCQIQVSYAIGVSKPTSVYVSIQTFGTGRVSEEKLAAILMEGGIFDFRPGMLVRDLGLLQPQGWCYRQTATYGHFGRAEFPWEKTDRVEALREAAGWHP
jgi:S-adenosylmethionine synthetase